MIFIWSKPPNFLSDKYRMDNNAKKFIREYVAARGGKDALTEDEKKALVELARKKTAKNDSV